MKESKHTPGPWRLDCPEHPETASVIGPDGKHVVAGEYDGWMVPFACRDGEEGVANARLIAAAPDLLEACKLAYEQLSHYDCSNGVTSPMGDIDEGNVYAGRTSDALQAAIAKATGEAK